VNKNSFFEDRNLAESLKTVRKKAKEKKASTPKQLRTFGCEECGLSRGCYTPNMKGVGNPNAKIMIIGEAPGETEDAKGIPFVGKTGRFLRKHLVQAGIDPENHCFITNACRCRPPDNETPTSKQVMCCSINLKQEIQQVKPEVILVVGGKALEALIGKDEISKYRGFFIPFKEYETILLPTFHPSYIQRNLEMAEMCMEEDMQKLRMHPLYTDYDMNTYEANHKILTTPDEIQELLLKVKTVEKFAIDFETTSSTPDTNRRDQLKPFNKSSRILMCSIAYSPMFSYSFDINESTIKFLRAFFCDTQSIKIMHNFKFEQIWGLIKGGTGLFNLNLIHDTMYFSYLLNEIKGINSLDFQAFVRLGLHKMKGLEPFMSHMEDAPYELAHKYCGMDSKLEYRLHSVLYPELQKYPKLLKVYKDIITPGAQATTISEADGVIVDWDKVSVTEKKYEQRIIACIKQLYSSPEVQLYRENHEKFNLRSTKNMLTFMQETGRGDNLRKTEKGNLSIDAAALKKQAETGDKFCQDLLTFRDLGKAKSTYMEGMKKFMYDDEKIHTDYNLHTTETGRLSSNSINLQNIDKHKHKEIRTFFIPPKGHLMMSFDYAGAEVRGACYVSQDVNLRETLLHEEPGVGIHGEWATKIFGVVKGEPEYKDKRYKSKNGFVFPLIYGSSYKSIAVNLGIDEETSKKLCDEFYNRYEGIWGYHKEVLNFYKKNGYIETLFGRRRRAPLTYNQIINSPIQSIMSDFTLMSMVKVIKQGFKCPLMIHDDLTLYVPENRIKETFEEVAHLMTNYNFKFMNVPLEVECKVGENWGQLIDIQEVL
jgi:DNA polymerase-1